MVNAPQFDSLADMESSMWLAKTKEKMSNESKFSQIVNFTDLLLSSLIENNQIHKL
jgi:hypothetical protein